MFKATGHVQAYFSKIPSSTHLLLTSSTLPPAPCLLDIRLLNTSSSSWPWLLIVVNYLKRINGC